MKTEKNLVKFVQTKITFLFKLFNPEEFEQKKLNINKLEMSRMKSPAAQPYKNYEFLLCKKSLQDQIIKQISNSLFFLS